MIPARPPNHRCGSPTPMTKRPSRSSSFSNFATMPPLEQRYPVATGPGRQVTTDAAPIDATALRRVVVEGPYSLDLPVVDPMEHKLLAGA